MGASAPPPVPYSTSAHVIYKITIFNMHRARIPEPNPRPNEGDDELVCEIHGGKNKRAKIIEQLRTTKPTEGKKLMVCFIQLLI